MKFPPNELGLSLKDDLCDTQSPKPITKGVCPDANNPNSNFFRMKPTETQIKATFSGQCQAHDIIGIYAIFFFSDNLLSFTSALQIS